jgi:hypothetical protein
MEFQSNRLLKLSLVTFFEAPVQYLREVQDSATVAAVAVLAHRYTNCYLLPVYSFLHNGSKKF